MPDRQTSDMAVARAAAEVVAQRKAAAGKSPAPTKSRGSDLMTAAVVVGLLMLTVVLAVYVGG